MYIFVHCSVGWGASAHVQGFGEPTSTKAQLLNLIRSIRTVAKSMFNHICCFTMIIYGVFFYSTANLPEYRRDNIQIIIGIS